METCNLKEKQIEQAFFVKCWLIECSATLALPTKKRWLYMWQFYTCLMKSLKPYFMSTAEWKKGIKKYKFSLKLQLLLT